jgi:hypothetical protein
MAVEEKGNPLGIKGANKKEKLRELSSYYAKFFENNFPRNGVEGIYNIHLYNHPIDMDVLNNSNAMNHRFTPL